MPLPKGTKRVGVSMRVELHKRGPFQSSQQEVYLAVMRTASVLGVAFDRFLKGHGLSQGGYNVLRILRGAGAQGCLCNQIGEHLAAHVPDVTRLVSRLERAGLCVRVRSEQDRRGVCVRLTPAGDALLARLDEPMLNLHREQLRTLKAGESAELLRLLSLCRDGAREQSQGQG